MEKKVFILLLLSVLNLTVTPGIADEASGSETEGVRADGMPATHQHRHDTTSLETVDHRAHHHGGDRLSRPDDHAPISVMGAHTHHAGDWMLSYRYMNMEMDQMRNNSSSVSSADVFAAGPYAVTPTSMTHEMHMFGLMYTPHHRVTLMAMANYQFLSMDHLISPTAPPPLLAANNGSSTFTTESEGWGDTRLAALVTLFEERGMQLQLGIGFSLPTGSITEKDARPVPFQPLRDRILPASMQLGSGTFDWHPSLNWSHQFEHFSYGTQVRGVARFHDNHEGYQLGSEFAADVWGQVNLAEWVSLSGGFGYKWVGDLEGRQDSVGQFTPVPGLRTIPTAWGENYGYQQVDAIVGLNFLVPRGFFRDHRLAIDARIPFYRHHDGYRLETDYVITAGWQWSF